MKLDNNKYFIFSGGEVHCNIEDEHTTIVMKDYTMNGFMALAEHIEVINRNYGRIPSVVYPYLPYARQDRVINDSEPFSLKVFCNLLNSLNIPNLFVYDPHSDVGPGILNNCLVIEQFTVAQKAIPYHLFNDPNVIFVSPDAGAYKKLSKLIKDDIRIAIGSKVRDAQGNVFNSKIWCSVDLKGKDFVIVDDICDGGRTFTGLADKLKEAGAKDIYLYVTHGIFSKGLLPLKDAGFKTIFTTDSFTQEKDSFVKVLKLGEI